MSEQHTFVEAIHALQQRTVVVIPVYLPDTGDDAVERCLVRDNLAACVHQMGAPGRVCVSVDGVEHGGAVAAELAAEFGIRTVTTPENAGKLHALRSGVAHMLAGAHLVLVRRSTINQQPVSAFGLLERTRLVADKMVWPCKRLGVPPHVVDQWLRNHIPRLLLNTLVPQGKEELLEIRRLVMQDFGMGVEDDICWGPLFV